MESTQRRRPDRAAKLKARKEMRETVVKSRLDTRIAFNADTPLRGAVLDAIWKRVHAYSKRVHIASLALNLLIRERVQSFPDDVLHLCSLPDIVNQTFLYQLLVGTDAASKPCAAVQHLYGTHPDIRARLDAAGRFLGDGNIYAAGAIKYGTNLKVHLATNLTKMVKQFVYAEPVQRVLKTSVPTDVLGDNKKTVKWVKAASRTLLYCIHGWPSKAAEGWVDHSQLPMLVTKEVVIQRQILGLDSNIDTVWLKNPAHIPRMLLYFVYVNRFLQRHDLPLRSLLPLCSARAHFATFDTSVLYGVLADAGVVRCSGSAFKAMGEEHWQAAFKLRPIQGKDAVFTGTMETDGTSACFHFRRPKAGREVALDKGKSDETVSGAERLVAFAKQVVADNPESQVYGIDPGRTNIMYAVKVDPGNVGCPHNVVRLSRRQYYAEAGMYKARKNTERWHQGMRPALTALSEASAKGADATTFRKHVATLLENYDALWTEYLKPRWANQRLRLYGGKKRVFARFFNKLVVPGKRTVVAYGAAKFAPGGRGEVAVPTTRAFKECRHRFLTVPVDEFRTSKMFNGDKETVLKRVVEGDGKEVRGLLWCCSTIQ